MPLQDKLPKQFFAVFSDLGKGYEAIEDRSDGTAPVSGAR